MKVYKGIGPLVDLYDVFFIDVYGVLFDGIRLYNDAIPALEFLKNAGKKIIILSNSTELSESARVGYSRRGLLRDRHYDYYVTSGEFLHRYLIKNAGHIEGFGTIKTVKRLFMGNNEIFKDTGIKEVDSFEEADILYVGFPRITGYVRIDNILDEKGKLVSIEDVLDADWSTVQSTDGNCDVRSLLHALEICLEQNKTLLVCNPDVFAPAEIDNQKYSIITQGAIGAYYKKMGGNVVYFGKPYPKIFELAKTLVDPSARIVMIGDTPWTDIAGANNVGIDSILVRTGISTAFNEFPTDDENLDYILGNVANKLNHTPFKNVAPTYIAERFGI